MTSELDELRKSEARFRRTNGAAAKPELKRTTLISKLEKLGISRQMS